MPSQPIATWITPCSSRSVKADVTKTRRHTIGLMPTNETLTWRMALASSEGVGVGAFSPGGFGPRFIPPD